MKRIMNSAFIIISLLAIVFAPLCYANDSNGCGLFVIPFSNTITIDGNISDWSSISQVFTDPEGDNYIPPGELGTDLESFSIARDNEFLYLMITLYDGDPKTDYITQYGFQANQIDDSVQPDDHLAKAYTSDASNWFSGVHVRSTTGGGDISQYPSEYVGTGPNFIEWKVALPDMGVIDGKYVNVYIHTGGYDVSDYFDGCIQIFLEDPSTAIKGDLDSDGDVDGEDLGIFSQFYGTVPLTP